MNDVRKNGESISINEETKKPKWKLNQFNDHNWSPLLSIDCI